MDIAKRSSSNPLLSPRHFEPYIEGMYIECLLNPGVFANVVFTNGHYIDGDIIKMYYGASD